MKLQAKNLMWDSLYKKIEPIFSEYMEENNMPYYVYNSSVYLSERDKIADEQTNLAMDDFFEQYPDLAENNMSKSVIEFVQENYSNDFLKLAIDQKINTEKLTEHLIEIIEDEISHISPYNSLSREFWIEKARNVPSNSELAGYIKNQNYEVFIESYAPDWQEIQD